MVVQNGQIHMGSLEQSSCNEQMASKGECFNQLNLPNMCHWGNIYCAQILGMHTYSMQMGLHKGNYAVHIAQP
jgi:hypothetical protein